MISEENNKNLEISITLVAKSVNKRNYYRTQDYMNIINKYKARKSQAKREKIIGRKYYVLNWFTFSFATRRSRYGSPKDCQWRCSYLLFCNKTHFPVMTACFIERGEKTATRGVKLSRF